VLADRISQYVHGLDAAVAAAVNEAAARVPAFAERLAAADINEVREVADLDRLQVLGKDELIAAQEAAPPFGGAVAPNARLRKVFASPGPLFEPQLNGTDPWHWAEALRAAEFGPHDVVLNCFSYHLSPAGAMFEEGALALGATVIPAGVGNQELQIQTAVRVGASAYTGLPSYLKALLEKAAALGEPLAIRRALVTAEPLPDSLRDWLTSYVDTVHQAYGTAETGLLGYETEPNSGLALPDGVLVQICDPATGAPVDDATTGQIRHRRPVRLAPRRRLLTAPDRHTRPHRRSSQSTRNVPAPPTGRPGTGRGTRHRRVPLRDRPNRAPRHPALRTGPHTRRRRRPGRPDTREDPIPATARRRRRLRTSPRRRSGSRRPPCLVSHTKPSRPALRSGPSQWRSASSWRLAGRPLPSVRCGGPDCRRARHPSLTEPYLRARPARAFAWPRPAVWLVWLR
jgi:hypothetical protein